MPAYTYLGAHADEAYRFLIEARPAGGPVASCGGTTVAEAVIDRFGRRFVYAGIAPRRPDGRPDVAALRPGEFLVAPGIVYRWDESQAAPDRRRGVGRSWPRRLAAALASPVTAA